MVKNKRAIVSEKTGRLVIAPKDVRAEFNPMWQCWRVEFTWLKTQFDIQETKSVSFVRAGDPTAAGMVAQQLWEFVTRSGKFEKLLGFKKAYAYDAYPMSNIFADATVFGEDEYRETLKLCRRLSKKVFVFGNPKNPKAFWPYDLSATSKLL